MDDSPSLDTRDVTSQDPSSSQQQSPANPERESAHVTDVPSSEPLRTHDKAQSTPHQVSPVHDVELPPAPRHGTRRTVLDYLARPLDSRVRDLIPEDFKCVPPPHYPTRNSCI